MLHVVIAIFCCLRNDKSFQFPQFPIFTSTEFPSERMLALFRNWKNKNILEDVDRMKNLLTEKVSSDNHSTLE